MSMPKSFEFSCAGTSLRLETGHLARQATAALLLRAGDSAVFAALVAEEERSGADFIPLTVEYREKASASAKIPFSGRGRDGRPQDREVLVARLIDRAVRPLLPAEWRQELQLQVQVLSIDSQGPDVASLAVIAAGLAFGLSPVPFNGPILATRLIANEAGFAPADAMASRNARRGDLTFAWTKDGIAMLEGFGHELTEAEVLEALRGPLADSGETFAALSAFLAANRPAEWPRPEAASLPLGGDLQAATEAAISELVHRPKKEDRKRGFERLVDDPAYAAMEPNRAQRRASLERLYGAEVRAMVANTGRRLDGRDLESVRPIQATVGWLPAPHGSALFARGRTQAAVTATLDTPRNTGTEDAADRPGFMLQYNFPGFSVGELKISRGPARREIGHGQLAQRALEALVPSLDRFPYAIRVESDILESDGSSSMATVAGASLALMDAGVPLSAAAAGVAIGLICVGDRKILLTDILGEEDACGDMDFKVAGTSKGITAMQLDNKIGGLDLGLLEEALGRAQKARAQILAEMAKALPAPRAIVADGAPRTIATRIPRDLIGRVIGAKGAAIRALQAECGVEVDVQDDGKVTITTKTAAGGARALGRLREMVGTVSVGEVHFAKVVRTADAELEVAVFEEAVGYLPRGSEELLPLVGEELLIQVQGVDDRGRLRFSRA